MPRFIWDVNYFNMKKIIFLITAIVLISTGSVSSQSKKELKAMAKIQEDVNATTTNAGSRFFSIKSTHISFYASPTFEYVDGAAKIYILIQNRNSKDEHLTLYGNGGEYTYNTQAEDDLGRFYNSSRFTFAVGGSDRFEGRCNDVLVPAQGVLKLVLKIDNVRADVTKFSKISFGYKAALEGITMTRKATIVELPID